MTDSERAELNHLRLVAAAAEKMRAAQVHYFRHRDNLGDCKQLERRLDDLLADDPQARQPGLFDAVKEE
jgi:hypothetical protein